MTVYLSCSPELVELRALAESEVGGTIGDLVRLLEPGDSFLGWDFAHFLALGDGAHTLDPRDGAEGSP